MQVTQINHIGIAVKDLETAAQVYQAMGLSISEIVDVPEQKVRVAFIPIGESTIELVQPTSEDSPVAKHLEQRGEGLHHLAVQVDDISAALAELASQGLQLIDKAPRRGAEGQIAFVHPKSTGRVLIELVEAADVLYPHDRQPIRVLIAKPGLDGHDRGAKIVARALRDAGMEVIYAGLRQTPEMIVEAALQEDVDVVGLSILSGAHMTLFPRVLNLLRENGMEDVLVIGGGIIPLQDIPVLQEMGVAMIFGPGSPLQDIVAFIQNHVTRSTSA